MDLIRLIKLKRINGELDNLTEPELFFISIFDKLYRDTKYNAYIHVGSNVYYFKYTKDTNVFYTTSVAYFLFHEKYGYLVDDYNIFISVFFHSKLGILLSSKIISSVFSCDELIPTENPTSNCFGCTAGMCDHEICRGDMYYWYRDNVKE